MIDKSATIPTTGIMEYVVELAEQHGVTYVKTINDEWADTVTQLAGDGVTCSRRSLVQ